eukprot:TRINITY_DN6827_c0_g1_i4.p1 TRINITY_DN6827_c0_g1~~TRINITY_DN6827_c0_g1_i4.p1  ORF type:complete len:354 (+),score=36.34 TRINITY_DN6827_c0_g1_i4:153-1214(+)
MPLTAAVRRRGRQIGVAIALAGLAVTCVGVVLRRRKQRRLAKERDRKRDEQASNAAAAPLKDEPVSSEDWEHLKEVPASIKSAEAAEPLEHALIQSYFRCTPQELLRFLFHPNSSFLNTWAEASELRGMAANLWNRKVSEPSLWYRTVYYEMPVRAALGPPFAHTTERQTLQLRAARGWIARVKAETPNVPFGARFHTEVLFRAWQLPSGHCALHVSGDIIFTGSTGLLRGTISRAAIKGLRTTYDTIQHVTSQKLPLGGGLDEGARLPGLQEAAQIVTEKVAAADEKIAATELAEEVPRTWHMQIVLLVFFAFSKFGGCRSWHDGKEAARPCGRYQVPHDPRSAERFCDQLR